MSDYVLKSEQELLLEEWQERLGLQDWTISLCYNCKFDDLETENSCGETVWSTVLKDAMIKIISEEEFGDDRTLKFDFEKTLVHELLHIKFCIFEISCATYEGKIYDSLVHQMIDDLARALVMAKRGKTRLGNSNCEKVSDLSAKQN